jgi:superfamily II DNA or RNA helicase
MAITLRDYQVESVERLLAAPGNGCTRPAVVLPTGSGKTIIFGEMARRMYANGDRLLVLVHGDTLVEQNRNKIAMMVPDAKVGIVKAEKNEVSADIVVGSVDTLRNPLRLAAIGHVDGVVVDEAHHAVADTYMDILRTLGSFEDVPTYGFTATMLRADSRHLGDVWQDIVFERPLRWMIQRGHLVEPHGLTVDVPDLELPGLKRGASDYSDDAVATAITSSSAAQRVVDAWLDSEDASSRPTAVFAPNKAVAALFAETFSDAGVSAEVVVAETPREERAAMFRRFRRGETRVLASCGVLLEGWDEPCASCAIVARLTESQGLYVQMVGRVLRLHPGKTDALVMDVVGVAGRHSLRCLADLSESRKRPEQLVEDGETLSQAAERWEQEDWHDPLVMPDDKPIELVPVDLFADAYSMWLQTDIHDEDGLTYGGTWFCGSPKRYYFLWELSDGTYNIRSSESTRRLGRPTLHGEGVDLAFAMAEVEGLVSDDERGSSFGTGKKASWRKGNVRPTDKQVEYARRVGALKLSNGQPIYQDGKPLGLDGIQLTKGTIAKAIDSVKVNGWLRQYERQTAMMRKNS